MNAITIMPLVSSMEEMLMNIEKNVVLEKLPQVTGVSVSLAAFCCCLALVGVGMQYLRSQQFDVWQMARPIVIFLLVANFSTCVVNPLRGVTSVFNTSLSGVFGGSMKEFKEVYKEESRKIHDANVLAIEDYWDEKKNEAEANAGDGFLQGIWSKAKGLSYEFLKGFFSLDEDMFMGFSNIICGILFFLLNISVSVMTITSRMFLMIMVLIGPYTFAISIIPAFSNGVKLWIERYIQYTLWQPLLYIVMFIGMEIMIQFSHLGSNAITGPFWTWVFLIMAIFSVIKSVPTLASHIIEGQGTEALANAVSGVGGQALSKASYAAQVSRGFF